MTKTKFFWKQHPNQKLQLPWNLTQLGLLIFPILPSLGAVSFVIASVATWRQKHRTIRNRLFNWGFVLLSVLLVITTGLANDKIAAFLGLFNFVPFFLLFAAFSVLIQTTTQLRQLSWILAIGSIPVVVIGAGNLFLGWSTSSFWEILLGWKLEKDMSRMDSVMINSNFLAAYLVIVFILGLGLWIENSQEIKLVEKKVNNRKFTIPTFPTPFIFLTIILIGDVIGLILTYSRNGWGNVIIACMAYAVYQGWYWIIGVVSAMATSVIMAARAPLSIAELFRKVVPKFLWIRFHNQEYAGMPLAHHRTTQWKFIWSLTVQRPWNGWGLRNFTPLYEAETGHWIGHPHNLCLMLCAETGLPTTILFCGLLGWLFITSVRLQLSSKYLHQQDKLIFFSYLLAFMAWIIFNSVDVTIFDFRLNTLFWLTVAAVCGVTYNYNPQLKKRQSQVLNIFFPSDDYHLTIQKGTTEFKE